METILIDEKELNKTLVDKMKTCNAKLINQMNKKSTETGINPNSYVGGLMTSINSEGLSLESNINNLIAAYVNNFSESIFYQLENIKKRASIDTIIDYLQSRGLESDFANFKASKNQGSDNQKGFIPIDNTGG